MRRAQTRARDPQGAHEGFTLTIQVSTSTTNPASAGADFASLGVSAPLLGALAAAKLQTPTPIQSQAVPAALAGRDVLGIAQTGSGKTAAFVLPMLQRLAGQRARDPGAPVGLVLAPTRELAIQIAETVDRLGRGSGLRHTVICGGVPERRQIDILRRGVEIVVATPGRLIDLARQGHLRVDRAQVFVLDEADRMLDMGFIRDVRRIVAGLPQQRQSLMFSATMPAEVARLADGLLREPLRIDLAPATVTVDRIDQRVLMVDASRKRGALLALLEDPRFERVLVFTRTKHGANRVARQIEDHGFPTAAFHGNKSQNARQAALGDFAQGRIRILVATDIAARGIDVPNITRVGRTARAAASGAAISLCAPDERGELRAIERVLRRALPVEDGNGLSPGPSRAPAGGAPRQPAHEEDRAPRRRGDFGRHRNRRAA
jgi:ATP-dependent RNA helicase RhlE